MMRISFLKPSNLFFVFYFICLFVYLLYINLSYLQGIPHVPDSVAYVFMAKMFATGHIILPIPANPDHFRFFDGTLTVSDGRWLFQYPFGHPLLLSIGMLLGLPNAIPPLIGTLTILEIMVLCNKLYSKTTLFSLLPLPFISPFFLENSASFMSHSTAAFYLCSAFLCFIIGLKTNKKWIFLLAGIFIGLLFNTRPLTALPFFLVLLCLFAIKRKEIKKWYQAVLLFLIGFGLLFLLWMLYNMATTGSPLVSQYFEVNKGIFGVGGSETLSSFLTSRFTNMSILAKNFFPMLYNLPLLITLPLLMSFLLRRKKPFWDLAFFFILFLLPITYFFYNGTFLMYGPRFWYEMIPFTFIITARSLAFLYEKIGKSAVGIVLALVLVSLLRFYAFIPTTNPDFFSPLKLRDLKGFNFIDNRITTLLKNRNIHHAVVFVEDCQGNWWCYGSVFAENSPYLTSDIIYVKDLGEENTLIKDRFPTRRFYTVNYDTQVLHEIK